MNVGKKDFILRTRKLFIRKKKIFSYKYLAFSVILSVGWRVNLILSHGNLVL